MTDVSRSDSRPNLPGWLVIGAPSVIMAAIFALSSRSTLPDLDGKRDIENIIGHFVAYAALAASLVLLLRWLGRDRNRALIGGIVLATLYGITDEFHQWFVPNRSTDPKDVLVDLIGAIVGALLITRILDRRAAGQPPPS